MSNILEVKFSAKSENESLSRVIVASFAAKLDPTLDELSDIKMAVSEAVTNSIIHGYEEKMGIVKLICKIAKNEVFGCCYSIYYSDDERDAFMKKYSPSVFKWF